MEPKEKSENNISKEIEVLETNIRNRNNAVRKILKNMVSSSNTKNIKS